MTKHTTILQSRTKLVTCQLFLLVAIFFFWWLMTKPGLVPPFMFEDENQAAFFFGEPVQIFKVIWVCVWYHCRPFHRTLACACSHSRGDCGSLYQGSELDAPRDFGPDLRRMVRLGHWL